MDPASSGAFNQGSPQIPFSGFGYFGQICSGGGIFGSAAAKPLEAGIGFGGGAETTSKQGGSESSSFSATQHPGQLLEKNGPMCDQAVSTSDEISDCPQDQSEVPVNSVVVEGLPENADEYRGVYHAVVVSNNNVTGKKKKRKGKDAEVRQKQAWQHGGPCFESQHSGSLGRPYRLARAATGRWILTWRELARPQCSEDGDYEDANEEGAGFRSVDRSAPFPGQLKGGWEENAGGGDAGWVPAPDLKVFVGDELPERLKRSKMNVEGKEQEASNESFIAFFRLYIM